MFASRTLLVVGAGASAEVGLPTGAGLALQISELLDIRLGPGQDLVSGDPYIAQALRHTPGNFNSHLRGARAISDAMPVANSIDEFMDQHKDDEEVQLCGKLAIVKSILIAERRSKLYVDWRAPYAGARRFEQALDSWFVRFFKIASKGIAKANANQALDNIFVINFNYDRCLEVFLRDALFALYRMDNDVADRILDQRVLHPYGRIGSLPSGSVMDPLPFGADEDWVTNLSRLSKGIHTFTEQIGDAQVVGRIREEISKAKVIIFLGFGFHRQNMDLLTSGTRSVVRRIYATSYGMSDPDRNLVQNQLKERLSNPSVTLRIEMPNNLTCKQLFDDYQRSLSN